MGNTAFAIAAPIRSNARPIPRVAAEAAGAKIRLTGIEKRFVVHGTTVEAVQATDLDVAEGEFVCLVGPSGCGKTTLLRIVAGLEEPTAGTIDVERSDGNRPVNAMVFQQESLFPWKSVWENIEFALRVRKVPKAERVRRTEHWLDTVGLLKFGSALPYQLSGGMKQRVSLARAFALDPEILVMDEPFAALDQQTKLLLQSELIRIWSDTGKTVLFVTHNIDEAVVLGDRVVVMTAHPGRVKAHVEIDLPRPRDPMEVRSDVRYMELTQQIWHELRSEVVRAQELETGR